MNTQKLINELTYGVIGCAIEVHKHLGAGLLESIYHQCLIEELKLKNINFYLKIINYLFNYAISTIFLFVFI